MDDFSVSSDEIKSSTIDVLRVKIVNTDCKAFHISLRTTLKYIATDFSSNVYPGSTADRWDILHVLYPQCTHIFLCYFIYSSLSGFLYFPCCFPFLYHHNFEVHVRTKSEIRRLQKKCFPRQVWTHRMYCYEMQTRL